MKNLVLSIVALSLFSLLFLSPKILAQSDNSGYLYDQDYTYDNNPVPPINLNDDTTSDEDAFFGLLLTSGFLVCYCVLFIVLMVVSIWMIVWTYKDAMKKNNPNAIIWAVLVFLFGFIAFIIYLLIRNDHLKNQPVKAVEVETPK